MVAHKSLDADAFMMYIAGWQVVLGKAFIEQRFDDFTLA